MEVSTEVAGENDNVIENLGKKLRGRKVFLPQLFLKCMLCAKADCGGGHGYNSFPHRIYNPVKKTESVWIMYPPTIHVHQQPQNVILLWNSVLAEIII